jgi:quercetin dioxygenase-like cupin family protein
MKRTLTITTIIAALATTAVAVAAGHGHKISEKVLAVGGVAQPISIQTDQPGVVVARAVVPPGASFGWHSHRSAVVAMVHSGTLTLYDSADQSCAPHRYRAGQGFTEAANHVHLARNEGHKAVVVFVTYVGLPAGVTNPDVPAASPGNCPF